MRFLKDEELAWSPASVTADWLAMQREQRVAMVEELAYARAVVREFKVLNFQERVNLPSGLRSGLDHYLRKLAGDGVVL